MFESEQGDRIYEAFIKQLENKNLSSVLNSVSPKPKSVRVKLNKPHKRHIEQFSIQNPHIMVEPDISYCFEFTYSKSEFEFYVNSHKNKHGSNIDSNNSINRFYCNISNSYANRLIILLNIAAPGFCDSHACVVETSSGFYESGDPITTHAYELLFDDFFMPQHNFPSIEIDDILKWSLNMEGFWNGEPKTNLQRSLCYFSYLFPREKSDGYFDTSVWAFGAIDAIYSDTHVGNLEKLKKRSKLILSDMGYQLNTKAINYLYNDRSRVFHGNMKFIANYSNPYDIDRRDRYGAGVYSSISTALFLLIFTFRYAIKNCINEIEFTEFVKLPAS